MADENSREHLLRLLEKFDTAMLVTRAMSGEIRSRPMAIVDREPSGDLWFITSPDAKVDEVQANPNVNVALQGKDTYISVSGRAQVVRDQTKIDEIWEEPYKVWFPEGKDDPNIILIRVTADEGEFWDNQGSKGIKFLLDATKAYVTGTEQEYDPEQNQKVDL